MMGRIRVLIDDYGLTISNPGGFIEGVTLDNLLEIDPHGRNTALADALKRIGLAERTGRGDRLVEAGGPGAHEVGCLGQLEGAPELVVRGVGLDGLVTYKYRLYGSGQIVGDYASGKKQFHFRDLPV